MDATNSATLPDLSDTEVSSQSLLIGFSYSLAPDGSPGSYNYQIAESIRNSLLKVPDPAGFPRVAMQWEIRDALGGNCFDSSLIVVPPPDFEEADIVDADAFVRLLKEGETTGARELAKAIRELLFNVGYESHGNDKNTVFDHASLNAPRLAIYLNRLLEDRYFYIRFRDNVELHDLHRSELGSVGVERREMPTGSAPLLPFQSRRVNRLIIEAVCPDEKILKRFKYLSTQGVLDRVLAELKAKRVEIKHVFVFAHPVHSPRCRRQTIESIWKADLAIPPSQVYDLHSDQEWEWDRSTAQIWCRSLENWLDYERLGQRRS